MCLKEIIIKTMKIENRRLSGGIVWGMDQSGNNPAFVITVHLQGLFFEIFDLHTIYLISLTRPTCPSVSRTFIPYGWRSLLVSIF